MIDGPSSKGKEAAMRNRLDVHQGQPTHMRFTWRVAEVRQIIDETPRVRSLVLDVPDWLGHRPGQHVDVRLTAEDDQRKQGRKERNAELTHKD
jgi:hypothetical protein